MALKIPLEYGALELKSEENGFSPTPLGIQDKTSEPVLPPYLNCK